MPLDTWFLDILACPRCHEKVTPTQDGNGLICSKCQLVYPVEDGVPQMLPDAGRPLDPARDVPRG